MTELHDKPINQQSEYLFANTHEDIYYDIEKIVLSRANQSNEIIFDIAYHKLREGVLMELPLYTQLITKMLETLNHIYIDFVDKLSTVMTIMDAEQLIILKNYIIKETKTDRYNNNNPILQLFYFYISRKSISYSDKIDFIAYMFVHKDHNREMAKLIYGIEEKSIDILITLLTNDEETDEIAIDLPLLEFFYDIKQWDIIPLKEQVLDDIKKISDDYSIDSTLRRLCIDKLAFLNINDKTEKIMQEGYSGNYGDVRSKFLEAIKNGPFLYDLFMNDQTNTKLQGKLMSQLGSINYPIPHNDIKTMFKAITTQELSFIAEAIPYHELKRELINERLAKFDTMAITLQNQLLRIIIDESSDKEMAETAKIYFSTIVRSIAKTERDRWTISIILLHYLLKGDHLTEIERQETLKTYLLSNIMFLHDSGGSKTMWIPIALITDDAFIEEIFIECFPQIYNEHCPLNYPIENMEYSETNHQVRYAMERQDSNYKHEDINKTINKFRNVTLNSKVSKLSKSAKKILLAKNVENSKIKSYLVSQQI